MRLFSTSFYANTFVKGMNPFFFVFPPALNSNQLYSTKFKLTLCHSLSIVEGLGKFMFFFFCFFFFVFFIQLWFGQLFWYFILLLSLQGMLTVIIYNPFFIVTMWCYEIVVQKELGCVCHQEVGATFFAKATWDILRVGGPLGVMAKVLDCYLEVHEFKF